MTRGLDHLVLVVHDLDAAGGLYEAMGFRVGARNRHPWGTENRIVQFPGTFLELITVGGGAEIPPHLGPSFSFGAFVRDAQERGEGFAMLVLESQNAEADKAVFDAAGVGGFDRTSFSRLARRPDGSTVHVAFSLAFARDKLAPEVGFFVCQQHYPENFWNPAFQAHPNGATGVPGVLMVAENPSAHAEFFTDFTGQHDLVSHSGGIVVPTPRGRIEVLTGASLAFHTGLRLAEEPPRFVAFRVAVPEIAALETRLQGAGLPVLRREGTLVVPPEAAHGTAIIFEA
jgi:catechol 2,3-dioxygenase-like lactoylglutathione lyase family enzyme